VKKTVIAIRFFNDVIRLYRLTGPCTSVPITKDVHTSVKQAHAKYVLALDKKKKDKQLNEEAIKKRLNESDELKALQKKQEDTFIARYGQDEH